MSAELDIHVASAEERIEAFDNLHEKWSRGLDRQSHLAWRIERPKHTNATWYVGCLDGRVVAGCGCYRMPLSIEGETVPAVGIGEVHTLPDYRGRGLASRLLPAVEADLRRQGVAVSLLFSDIRPAFYERLGYITAPSYFGWMNPQTATVESPLKLIEFVPNDHVAELAAMYAQYHRELPLFVARDAAYWDYLLRHEPTDRFLWIETSDGERIGYLRIAVTDKEARLHDLAFGTGTINAAEDERVFSTLVAVVRWAQTLGSERLGGWLPSTSAAYRRIFQFEPRDEEITMFKSLQDSLTLTPEVLAAADYLHEIDHV